MNILISLCILIISILSIYFANKYLKKLGLIITLIGMNLLSFILTFKYITIFTINLNANSITYITMFTSLYLLLEKTDIKETKQIINLNFIINIFSAIILYIMSYHAQSLTDTISINMKNVFLNNVNILIIYPFTTLLSHYLIIWMYNKIKKLYDLPFITTVTTFLLVGLIEGILYTTLSYYQILPTKSIITLILSTYMIRIIITIIYSIILPIMDQKQVIK